MAPEDVLKSIHRRIRCGDFDPRMPQQVSDNIDAWLAAKDTITQLRGCYDGAEVYDYFGDYSKAQAIVESFAPEQMEQLGRVPEREAAPARDTTKHRIWVGLAYATTLYRREIYDKSLGTPNTGSILDLCEQVVQKIEAPDFNLYGTRARLAYARGQLLRQLHDYAGARKSFQAAIVWAYLRFRNRTGFIELNKHKRWRWLKEGEVLHPDLLSPLLVAHWTIGKAQSLGLGWIEYVTGNLSAADGFISSGYALLRLTNDSIHRAYAQLLLGAVTRAKSKEDADVDRAITLITDAQAGLAKDDSARMPEHPFKRRADYELALSLYRGSKKEMAEAEKLLRPLVQPVKGTRRSDRWRSQAYVVLSRIDRTRAEQARREQRPEEERSELARQAVKHAEDAVEHAKKLDGDLRAEALIALGEARFEAIADPKDPTSLTACEEAINAFGSALEAARQNPKLSGVATLHLAKALARVGRAQEAEDEYATWTGEYKHRIEHGYVHALADQVDALLQKQRPNRFFVSAATLEDPKVTRQTLMLELEIFLTKMTRDWKPSDRRRIWGEGEATARKRFATLQSRSPEVPKLRRGRPKKATLR